MGSGLFAQARPPPGTRRSPGEAREAARSERRTEDQVHRSCRKSTPRSRPPRAGQGVRYKPDWQQMQALHRRFSRDPAEAHPGAGRLELRSQTLQEMHDGMHGLRARRTAGSSTPFAELSAPRTLHGSQAAHDGRGSSPAGSPARSFSSFLLVTGASSTSRSPRLLDR